VRHVHIRPLTPTDAAAYHALRLRGLREAPTAFASSYEEECEYTLDFVAGRLAPSPSQVVLGAFRSALPGADGVSDLAGIAGMYREPHRKLAHRTLIWGVFVAPDARRIGAARALIDGLVGHARAMGGVQQVHLSVNAANAPAIALYQAAGFTSFCVERHFMIVDGVPQDEMHMSLALR